MSILLFNGKIASLDAQDRYYESIGIVGNRIDFLGRSEEALKDRYETVIDLKGHLVLPGFNDSHMHLLGYAYAKKQIDLCKYGSIDEVIQDVKRTIRSQNIEEGRWVLGSGWNQEFLAEKRFFTREDLDAISDRHPIMFVRTCGHMAVCNTKAIDMMDADVQTHRNVELARGIFKEDAMQYPRRYIDSPGLDEIKDMIVQTSAELTQHGVTSVQSDDFHSFPDVDYLKILNAYEELDREGRLTVRVYEQCSLDRDGLAQLIGMGYRTGTGSDFFKVGPLKLFQDGGLGARTALLSEPYADDPSSCGVAMYPQDELDAFIEYAHKNGMQIAVHAIGDRAIEMVLASFENARQRHRRDNARHGIVHGHILTEDIMRKLSRQNVMVYVQPIFFNNDLKMLHHRVGDRAFKSYLIKALQEQGVHVSGGSDAPVEYFNPYHNIHSAVLRQDLQGQPPEGFIPEDRLSRSEALRLFTIDSAFASFEESKKGTLEVGKLADLIVTERDILTVPDDEIKDIRTVMTVVDGQIVWRREGSGI